MTAHVRSTLLLCLLLFDVGCTDDIASMAPWYIRTNWGVIFNKVGTVLNGITKYRHTFAVGIPVMNFTALRPMQCNSERLRKAHCIVINSLTDQLNTAYEQEFAKMKQSIDNMIRVIGNVESVSGSSKPTDNAGSRKKRRKRAAYDSSTPHLSPNYCKDGTVDNENKGGGFLSTIGKIGSDIFGTPTWDDIKVVDTHICELANSVDLNRQEIIESDVRLSSISGALNNRISSLQHGLANMNHRITETQQSLVNVSRDVVKDMNRLYARMNLIEATQESMYLLLGNIERFQHVAVRHLRYGTSWLSGMNQLLKGYIPQELITVDDIQNVLDHVNTVVLPKNPQLRMVHPNPSFYYQVRSTAYTRSQNYVFITLTVPLKSVGGVLGVYRVDKTHIATAEHHTSSTRISNLPDFFAVTPDLEYYTEFSVAHYTSCRGEGVKVCPTERALQDANRLSCVAALFLDKKSDVMNLCEFRYEQNDLPSEAIRLGDNRYLIHSKNAGPHHTYTLHCPYASPEPGQSGVGHIRTISSCNTCIVTVPCRCSLDGGTFLITEQLTGCPVGEEIGFPEVTKVYPVNLPVVASQYSIEDLVDVDGSSTHSSPSDENPLMLSDLHFNITDSNWEEVVAADEVFQTNLTHLIEQHKKQGAIYAHRSVYYLKNITSKFRIGMSKVKAIDDMIGGDMFKNFFNPSSILGSVSFVWFMAIITIVMSIYNCYRRRGK